MKAASRSTASSVAASANPGERGKNLSAVVRDQGVREYRQRQVVGEQLEGGAGVGRQAPSPESLHAAGRTQIKGVVERNRGQEKTQSVGDPGTQESADDADRRRLAPRAPGPVRPAQVQQQEQRRKDDDQFLGQDPHHQAGETDKEIPAPARVPVGEERQAPPEDEEGGQQVFASRDVGRGGGPEPGGRQRGALRPTPASGGR